MNIESNVWYQVQSSKNYEEGVILIAWNGMANGRLHPINCSMIDKISLT